VSGVETGKIGGQLATVPVAITAISIAIPTTIAIAVIAAAIRIWVSVRSVGTVGDWTAVDRVGDVTEYIAHLRSERDQNTDDHNRDQSEDERILY
jgi:hypothetical protein